jgi:hypothetical protein
MVLHARRCWRMHPASLTDQQSSLHSPARARKVTLLALSLDCALCPYPLRCTGIPVEQQALLFAGAELADEADLLEDARLGDYSLSQEAVVYLQPRLRQPRLVFLCDAGSGGGSHGCTVRRARQFPELLEGTSKLGAVFSLLCARGLTSGARGCGVPQATSLCIGIRQGHQPRRCFAHGGGHKSAQLVCGCCMSRPEQAVSARCARPCHVPQVRALRARSWYNGRTAALRRA